MPKLRQSKIEGIGVFADQFIKRGTRIWQFTPDFDLTISKEVIKTLPSLQKEFLLRYAYFYSRLGKYIFCIDNTRFLNHSENPNIISIDLPQSIHGKDIAAKDIKKGEELTCDYRQFDRDFAKKLTKKL